MSILNYTAKNILFFLLDYYFGFFEFCCGIWDPADARKVSPNVNERVRKNLEEGKGFSIKKKKGWVEQVINSPVLIQCGERH